MKKLTASTEKQGFYNHILYFSTMERAVSAELIYFDEGSEHDFTVLGHEATDDGDGPTLQFHTTEPLDQDTRAAITKALVYASSLQHASYNVHFDTSYEQYRQARSLDRIQQNMEGWSEPD